VNIYYVCCSGSDSNNGTSEESPFKTVDKVNEIAVDGDVVICLCRDHSETHSDCPGNEFGEILPFSGHVKDGDSWVPETKTPFKPTA